jgi:hypothetical protein
MYIRHYFCHIYLRRGKNLTMEYNTWSNHAGHSQLVTNILLNLSMLIADRLSDVFLHWW